MNLPLLPGFPMSDIEDFTTDQLRDEIRRRQDASRRGACWYCGQSIAAHTCKYAFPSPVPGWQVEPPKFLSREDCMGQPEEYWRTSARNPVSGMIVTGTGRTAAEATNACLGNILGRMR